MKLDTSEAVTQFLSTLEHPHKDLVIELRDLILATDPSIAEGIKWNAPSFRTTGYFATTHLRAKRGIGLILHLGAKARDLPSGFKINDPATLLQWLAKDRALLAIPTAEHLRNNAPAIQAILRHWIQFV